LRVSTEKRLNYTPTFVEYLHEVGIMVQRANNQPTAFVQPDFVTSALPRWYDAHSQSCRTLQLRRIDFDAGPYPLLSV
jgi:hypothetical protein